MWVLVSWDSLSWQLLGYWSFRELLEFIYQFKNCHDLLQHGSPIAIKRQRRRHLRSCISRKSCLRPRCQAINYMVSSNTAIDLYPVRLWLTWDAGHQLDDKCANCDSGRHYSGLCIHKPPESWLCRNGLLRSHVSTANGGKDWACSRKRRRKLAMTRRMAYCSYLDIQIQV